MTKPPARMAVEVELVEIAIDFEAHAGDFAMVFGGRIVGVHTGRPAALMLEAKRVEAPDKEPWRVAAGRKGGQAKKTRHHRAKTRGIEGMRAESQALALRILAVIRDRPGIGTSEMIDAVGYPRDAPDRWKPRDVAKAMEPAGLVTAELVGGNAKMGKLFTITDRGRAVLVEAGNGPGLFDGPGPDGGPSP